MHIVERISGELLGDLNLVGESVAVHVRLARQHLVRCQVVRLDGVFGLLGPVSVEILRMGSVSTGLAVTGS